VEPADYSLSAPLKKDVSLGYVYFMDRSHPLGDKKGRVWHHRHVASVALGRWVTSAEVVHHRDGCRWNNAENNLLVLGHKKHQEEHARMDGRPVNTEKICRCGERFLPATARIHHCSTDCAGRAARKFDPPASELERLVWLIPSTRVAAMYGVSDSAVARRCRLLGIKKPGRGYWS